MNVPIPAVSFTWKENYIVVKPCVVFDSSFKNVLHIIWLYKQVICPL